MTSASLLASAVAMLDGAVLTSVTSSIDKPTWLNRPAMYGSPPAPRVTPIFLPLSLVRSPVGAPASARAMTDRTSLVGFISALFHVCPISTTGTPRASAVRNGYVPKRPASTVPLASALAISTPLGIISTFTSRPSFAKMPRSTAEKNGAFSAAVVTATFSCCVWAVAATGRTVTSNPAVNAASVRAKRMMDFLRDEIRALVGLQVISQSHPIRCYHRLATDVREAAAGGPIDDENTEAEIADARSRLRALQGPALQAQPRAGTVRLARRALRAARRAARPDARSAEAAGGGAARPPDSPARHPDRRHRCPADSGSFRVPYDPRARRRATVRFHGGRRDADGTRAVDARGARADGRRR